MRQPWMCVVAALGLIGCGDDAVEVDGGWVIDAGEITDSGAHHAIDAGEHDAQVADAGATDAGELGEDAGESDAGTIPFVAIEPCLAAEDYVSGASIAALDSNEYAPACLRVRRGATVSIEGSDHHPLAPRSSGSPGNPIPSANYEARVRFDEVGFYPFLCTAHLGMQGVVQVVP